MKHPIIDDPLCSCVQAIQDKYVSIRNEAMYQDEKNNPEKKWSEAGYTTDKYKNACMQYAGNYLNELLQVKHTCSTNDDIQSYLDKDREYWATQFNILPNGEATKQLEKSIEGFKEQYQKFLALLKQSTGYLNELYPPEYWVFYNSLCHLRLNTELQQALPPQQTETKTDKLKAPVLALFCFLVNESGIDKKAENDSVESYCKRICEQYGLTYTDRIRQNYNGSNTRKTQKNLIETLLPILEPEIKDKIQKHLDSKNLPKQNLYA